MKYSFIMPYHKRLEQLKSTLESFLYFYHDRKDYEVIIVEDKKQDVTEDDKAQLRDLVGSYQGKINIKILCSGSDDVYNPAELFNRGAVEALGDYLVITNPECMHAADILSGFDTEILKKPEVYIVCANLSVSQKTLSVEQVAQVQGTWYQHSIHRNVMVHFCACLSKHQFIAIGEFDENYSKGYCFEDDDFRNKIIHAKISIITRDDLLTIHLNHDKGSVPDMLEKHNINKKYYDNKWGAEVIRAEDFKL